jgi:nucleotide-binding universal stress UspA family protein
MKVKPTKKPGKVLVEVSDRDTRLTAAAAKGGGIPSSFLKPKRILVPIDFSEHAKKALKYAAAFGEQFGAEVLLLHVVEPIVYPVEMGFVPPEIQDMGEKLVQNARERLQALADAELKLPIKTTALISRGTAFQQIATVAQEKGADLIIVTTHGYTGLKHVLLGSTAERVVRHAPCPVLVVRDRETEFV